MNGSLSIRRTGQAGFSLLELLLALGLGVVISTGAIQLYLASQLSYQVAEGTARLQENSRLAQTFLRSGLEQAGRPGYLNMIPIDLAESATFDGRISNVQRGDRVTVRFRGGADCVGAIDPSAVVSNQYFITPPGDGEPASLRCVSSLNLDADGQPVAEPIIAGVDYLQVQYGLAQRAPDNPGSTRYVSATALRALAADDSQTLSRIVSIRLAALLNTVTPTRQGNELRTFSLLDDDEIEFNDRLGRQVVTITVPLRNRPGM